jgi:squalene-hopene/tetraprenyl-beta-curcumene cyclase
MSAPDSRDTLRHATEALDRASKQLISLQNEAGWWKGELETNVSMDAEDLMLRQFMGISSAEVTRPTAAWIRSKQGSDGGWSIHPGGAPDVSVSIEAYTALRLAGDPTDALHMRRAASLVRELGGVERSRVFTRIWLALFGEWPWRSLPALPPELILLPEWFPLNVYDFACWARQTIVPLTIVSAHRPQRSLGFSLDELKTRAPPDPRLPFASWGGFFQRLDTALHAYERFSFPPLRRRALALAAEWVIRRQEADGCWGGIQPPWVYSIMALHLLGYPSNHPVMKKAIDGLDGFAVEEEGVRRFEACQSPVWDTALAVVALRDAGFSRDEPALRRAADYLLREEIRVPGDWAVRRPQLPPGGWAFEFENDNYPDLDDTAEVVMALRAVDHVDAQRLQAAVERGVQWTLGMQSADGGWAAFDADNTLALCNQLPFCDFGEVIDPPSADVTAHVIEMLAHEGCSRDPRVRRGVEWLLNEQEEDGSWFGRWGANHVYGTGAAIPALVAAGLEPRDPALRRAVAWLERVQNEDGGWGEDMRSYTDAAWRGRGESTPSQTAWALLALLAAGGAAEASERGVRWLVDHQRGDGGWDEEPFTGTGFPGDFNIKYHLYALHFPIMALGRFVQGQE